MKQTKKNISESVYNRLKNLARQKKRPVQEMFKYYAMERFLYRLGTSHHQNSFFLKGGLMLMVWDPTSHRATVDIDLLAKTSNRIDDLERIIQEICTLEVQQDGVCFSTQSLKIRKTQITAENRGLNVSFTAEIFTAKIPMRIDLGFCDTIYPKPSCIDYPTLLDFPKPKLKGYNPQTLIAEKFETIIRFDLANTRMKDFYDIWLTMQQFTLDQKELNNVVEKVLKNRETTINGIPKAFTETFYRDPSKMIMWKSFLKGISHDFIPFEKVTQDIKERFQDLFSKI